MCIASSGACAAPLAVADTNLGVAVVESGVQDGGNIAEPCNAKASVQVTTMTRDHKSAAPLSVAKVNGQSANVGQAVTGTYGSVTINSTGGYTYTLDRSEERRVGKESSHTVRAEFCYNITDEHGATATVNRAIAITRNNEANVA